MQGNRCTGSNPAMDQNFSKLANAEERPNVTFLALCTFSRTKMLNIFGELIFDHLPPFNFTPEMILQDVLTVLLLQIREKCSRLVFTKCYPQKARSLHIMDPPTKAFTDRFSSDC